MEKITAEKIQQMNKEVENDQVAKIMRHALMENDMAKIATVQEATVKTGFRFSIDIETMKAANQMSSGRCWLFAALNVMREKIARKFEIEDFEFSQNYVAFYDKLEKFNFMMESCIQLLDKDKDDRTLQWVLQTGVQDGGQWDMVVSLVKKYGLVPKSAMPETFQSSHTMMPNRILNTKLRRFNAQIRALHACGKDDEIADVKEKALAECYRFLCMCFGIPPKSFDFEYVNKNKEYKLEKNLTPKRFYEEFLGKDLDDFISIVNAPTTDKPFNHVFTVDYLGNVVGGNEIRYLNLDLKEFKELVLRQLKEKEVVWFGCDCSKDGSRESNIWDDRMYDYESAFGMELSLSKAEMLDNGHSAMNHAMVFTGVSLDEGKPTKWKIENSWGSDHANGGYHVASDTWFDKYVYQAVVDKKYLSEAQKEMLKGEVIHLNPWDPMGSLAD